MDHSAFISSLVAVHILIGAAVLKHGSTNNPNSSPTPNVDGFISLFNGHDLAGWEGLAGFWSVRDGAITGRQEKDTSKQTFLVKSGLNVGDFELHFKYAFKTSQGNSGIQFRSAMMDKDTFRVGGYQADFDAAAEYDGSIYDEGGIAGNRGTLSKRGERTSWDAQNYRHLKLIATENDTLPSFKAGNWNTGVLVARGARVSYSINGVLMTELVDESPYALRSGLLALQLHQGYTMDVRFKDLQLKRLE